MRKTKVEIIMIGEDPCVENCVDMLLDSLFITDLKGCSIYVDNEVLTDDA